MKVGWGGLDKNTLLHAGLGLVLGVEIYTSFLYLPIQWAVLFVLFQIACINEYLQAKMKNAIFSISDIIATCLPWLVAATIITIIK